MRFPKENKNNHVCELKKTKEVERQSLSYVINEQKNSKDDQSYAEDNRHVHSKDGSTPQICSNVKIFPCWHYAKNLCNNYQDQTYNEESFAPKKAEI